MFHTVSYKWFRRTQFTTSIGLFYNECGWLLWGMVEESDYSSNVNVTFIQLLRTLHFRLGKESNIVNDKSRNGICEEIWN